MSESAHQTRCHPQPKCSTQIGLGYNPSPICNLWEVINYASGKEFWGRVGVVCRGRMWVRAKTTVVLQYQWEWERAETRVGLQYRSIQRCTAPSLLGEVLPWLKTYAPFSYPRSGMPNGAAQSYAVTSGGGSFTTSGPTVIMFICTVISRNLPTSGWRNDQNEL